MPTDKHSFRISSDPWHSDYGIWLRMTDGAHVAFATNVHLENVTPDNIGFEPAALLRVTKPELQQLMDELWRVGIRPSEGSGSAGALAATERHLADMRALALQHLARPNPRKSP